MLGGRWRAASARMRYTNTECLPKNTTSSPPSRRRSPPTSRTSCCAPTSPDCSAMPAGHAEALNHASRVLDRESGGPHCAGRDGGGDRGPAGPDPARRPRRQRTVGAGRGSRARHRRRAVRPVGRQRPTGRDRRRWPGRRPACGSPTSAAWNRSSSASHASFLEPLRNPGDRRPVRQVAAWRAAAVGATRLWQDVHRPGPRRRAGCQLLRRRAQRRPRDVDRQERAATSTRCSSRPAAAGRVCCSSTSSTRSGNAAPTCARRVRRSATSSTCSSPSSTAPTPTTTACSSSAPRTIRGTSTRR